MAEHTPTPWAEDPDDREGMEWNVHIVQASNPDNLVCFMTSDGPAEANAAFICKAVNNHEALVAELQRLFDLYGHQATADVLAADVGTSQVRGE